MHLGNVGRLGFILFAVVSGCHRASVHELSHDRSFCAISAQAGKPIPGISEVSTLEGRYDVSLYSADSGRVLGRLDISLSPTDSLIRFHERIQNGDGTWRLGGRKVPLLATGDARQLKSRPGSSVSTLLLYYSEKPVISVFSQPTCVRQSCAWESQMGLLLNIRQVVPSGFSGTVDQVGVVVSSQAPGRAAELHGPHFFCAVKAR